MYTEEQLAISKALSIRSELFKNSDWTQLSDIDNNTKLKWQPYRQQLRDITLQSGYPFDITWPTFPE